MSVVSLARRDNLIKAAENSARRSAACLAVAARQLGDAIDLAPEDALRHSEILDRLDRLRVASAEVAADIASLVPAAPAAGLPAA